MTPLHLPKLWWQIRWGAELPSEQYLAVISATEQLTELLDPFEATDVDIWRPALDKVDDVL